MGTLASLGSTHVGSRGGAHVMAKWLAFVVLISSTLLAELAYSNTYEKTCPEGPSLQQWRQQLAGIKRQLRTAANPRVYVNLMSVYEREAAKFERLFLIQEIHNFPLFGNVQCLLWAMRSASGQDLKYTPYTDGKFDLLIGEKKIRDRISGADLLAIVIGPH